MGSDAAISSVRDRPAPAGPVTLRPLVDEHAVGPASHALLAVDRALGQDVGPQEIVDLGGFETRLNPGEQVGRLQHRRPPQGAAQVGRQPIPKPEFESVRVGRISLAPPPQGLECENSASGQAAGARGRRLG